MPGFWDAVAADSLTAERAAGSGLVPNGTPFPAESGKAGTGRAGSPTPKDSLRSGRCPAW